jgi:serine/threonine protein kinase
VEYPPLARQWRTLSVKSGESTSNLSAGGMSRPAAFMRGFNEKTESREELARSRGPDPESTEEIPAGDDEKPGLEPGNEATAANRQTAIARHCNALVSTTNGRRSALEVTHPIEVPRSDGPRTTRTTRATRPDGSDTINAAFVRHDPLKFRLVDDGEESRDLVELVVEADAPRTSVAPGKILAGRYVVIEEVDHCGMGLVYKALDRRREKAGMPEPWVALKLARPAAGKNSGTSSYLREEFLKLSQLSHPNIVSVFDFDNDEGLDFLVMEWLEGQTLAQLLTHITSKRIALGKAEDIVRSVGHALAHAHAHGIVHGDVKPSNIFLTENRGVKLLDFGSSGQMSAGGNTGNSGSTWATRAYASCEVLAGDAPRPHDDVYALGVTAYRLLSGERPFGDLDAVEARQQGLLLQPLPADAQDCWTAVQHALRFDAPDRPVDAEEFLLEFTDPPVEIVEPGERTQLEHIAYGAVAVALLIAIVAWTVGATGGTSTSEQLALDNAEQAFSAGRLMDPVDDSAFAWYSSILEASPDNAEAIDGMQRIAEHYLTQARLALLADDPETAAEKLATARRVMPDHYGIAITGDLIARYGKDLLANARQLADRDLGEAELLLARAAGFLPAGDPALERAEADFASLRVNAELENLLRGIDQRILAERLAIPEGDSAVDLLREARQLAPDNHQVSLAADRIATALLFQSMFAISSGKLGEAERYIDAAQALNVKHLALARAQYELAKARHEAVRTRGPAGS